MQRYAKSYKNLLVLGVIVLTACSSSSDNEIETTEMPMVAQSPLEGISAQNVQMTANSCRSQVENLWQMRAQVPRERIREFHIAVGRASESCDKLDHFNKQLATASQQEYIFKQNLSMAQTVAQGQALMPNQVMLGERQEIMGAQPLNDDEQMLYDQSYHEANDSGNPLSLQK